VTLERLDEPDDEIRQRLAEGLWKAGLSTQ
jgi:hypothetical protein